MISESLHVATCDCAHWELKYTINMHILFVAGYILSPSLADCGNWDGLILHRSCACRQRCCGFTCMTFMSFELIFIKEIHYFKLLLSFLQ